jgi:ATP-binding cassette subfamily B protein/subfamily B ATP-binding cassette protein MsbA
MVQEMRATKSARRWRYARLLSYPRRQWRAIGAILALTAALSGLAALQPWPLKILIDCALSGAALPLFLRSFLGLLSLSPTPPVLIVVAAAASLGLFLLNSALDASLTWLWSAVGQRMTYDLAGSLFQRLQRLSLLFHRGHTVGDSLNRLTDDSYCIYTLTNNLLVAPAQQCFLVVTVGVVAWQLNPSLTLISLAVAPLMGGSALFFGSRLKQRMRRNQEAKSRLMSFVHQILSAVPLVQAFGTEERNRQQFQHLAAAAAFFLQRGNLIQSSYGLANGSINTIATALVLYLGGRDVLAGGMTVGSLLVFLAYLKSLQEAFKSLFATYGNLKSAEANAERVLEILESSEAVREAPDARPLPLPSRGHLRLEGVTFGYEPGYPILQDITLEAKPGETIALVGATGAGKSTLVSLIPRFFDPWQGRVLFDGVDLRQVKLKNLRSQVALLLQEPFLLPLTVAENIAYGRPNASRNELVAAAATANADEFIRQLPQGYETVLGEQGATLSGGQKQRLAIARALLKQAAVLILDEPTSALDAQTEALLLEALERLMAGRTTFIIAHRLSTIRRADRIVVLEGGKIIEVGSHEQLLAAGGAYSRFYQLQDIITLT